MRQSSCLELWGLFGRGSEVQPSERGGGAITGYRIDSGRPVWTAPITGYRIESGRPVWTAPITGYRIDSGRPVWTAANYRIQDRFWEACLDRPQLQDTE